MQRQDDQFIINIPTVEKTIFELFSEIFLLTHIARPNILKDIETKLYSRFKENVLKKLLHTKDVYQEYLTIDEVLLLFKDYNPIFLTKYHTSERDLNRIFIGIEEHFINNVTYDVESAEVFNPQKIVETFIFQIKVDEKPQILRFNQTYHLESQLKLCSKTEAHIF